MLALGLGWLRGGVRGTSLPNELTQELKLGEEELPDYVPTEPNEEQRADNRSQKDQQSDPNALPHLSWMSATPASVNKASFS